ncbi:hypothetical protein CEUSTIGMA_g2856.t1 [Chlamydomonas eustigma]|uniref:RING-type domain-containing protein n=1 Tax=Chlamydomonas eustigma TaxID=1157962 RepID=A0A250WXR3_9CHLO|nr:hypothetical protein CEUSTIGMA_g2856.t1 [Chlamydomonas eustigma]|eukprot:GAX75412.1 hypothetical protein CEUSTIGMA_g2856.t1 [Chlamydomonas eustigma]
MVPCALFLDTTASVWKCEKDDHSMCRVKMQNLLPVKVSPATHAGPIMPDSEVMKCLGKEMQHHASQPCDRADMQARMTFVREHLESRKIPPPSICMEPMVDEASQNDHLKFMMRVKPCCAGDGSVVFNRFSAGMLIGTGNSACAICLQALEQGGKALGFPCGHLFHQACAAAWLQDHNTCPSCRFKLGMPGLEYMYSMHKQYEQRLRDRFREWFISGMCERCQAVIHEADPLCVVTLPDGASVLVPRSTLPNGGTAGQQAGP